MIKTATATDAPSTGRIADPQSPQSQKMKTGSAAVAAIEARDTYLNNNRTATKTSIAPRTASGTRARNAPTPVATPLPPRNFSHMGNMCPNTTKKAATATVVYNG